MKRFVLFGVTAALLLASAVQGMAAERKSAESSNSLTKGAFGINVQVNDAPYFSAKYMFKDDLAILAGLGLAVRSGDTKGTDVVIGAGAHKYLKIADFAPFVGARIGIASAKDGDSKTLMVQAEAGAEIFLHKHMSLEGNVAVGLSYADTKGLGKTTTIGTFTPGLSFNFYY
jgi:hypothetical protein